MSDIRTEAPAPEPEREAPSPAARLARFYETLTPASLASLGEFYAADARFKDPFNDVHGVPAIAQIFAHMFAALEQPRFVVTEQLAQHEQALLCWDFHFRMRRWRPRADHCIHGATLVRFDTQGRVIDHRDYWDAAELYEKFPLLGRLMRNLRKAVSVSKSIEG